MAAPRVAEGILLMNLLHRLSVGRKLLVLANALVRSEVSDEQGNPLGDRNG